MQPLVQCLSLTRQYGTRVALRDFSCRLDVGEVVGLLGPNGAGKSTLLRILAGAQFQTSGICRFAGTDNERWTPAVRRKIGYLPEQAGGAPELLTEEHLRFLGGLYGMAKPELHRRLEEMRSICHLEAVWRRPLGELSRGFRQRVGLAGALLHDPDLLLLDEPTTGLDPNEIASLLENIRELGQRKTVVHSTHILAEAQATCDRVWILHEGRLVADGVPSELVQAASGHGVELWSDRGDLQDLLGALPNVHGVAMHCISNRFCYTLNLARGDEDAVGVVGRCCYEARATVLGLRALKPDLYDVFASCTGARP